MLFRSGLVNVDFADVKAVLAGSGQALMSIGTGSGENRIQQAIEAAMTSPLLDVEIRGAKRVLINITSNENIQLTEVAEAASTIEAIVAPDANIIWGSVIDPHFPADQVKITLVATGITVMRETPRPGTRHTDSHALGNNGRPIGEPQRPAQPQTGDRGNGNGARPFGQSVDRTGAPSRPTTPNPDPKANGNRPPAPPPAQRPVQNGNAPLDRGVRSNFGEPRPYDDPNIGIPPWVRDPKKRNDSNN